MAGLLAARVLTDFFDQVTIVERDRFPDQPVPRKGIPQARHLHQLLVHGKNILMRLFPGIDADLVAAGAHVGDITADVLWLNPNGWAPRFASGLTTFACSRDLLEWAVRRRVATSPRIRFCEAGDVIGLLADKCKTTVTGVSVRPRDSSGEMALPADFVVDASGRTSQAPQWLEALGYPVPQETIVNAFLGYASRYYALTSAPDWTALLLQSRPPTNPRTGTMFAQEGQRWIVTLAGASRDYPPTDENGFLDFARKLADGLLYNILKDAEPLSPICGYRRSANRLRHFERLSRWPERFVVLGDAVCALNPYYAQGVTNAARAALTLGECLQKQNNLKATARHFQQHLARINRVPWLLATGEDFRYPATEGGGRTYATRLMHWYVDRALLRAAEREDMCANVLQVMHMIKPPSALLHPRVVARSLGWM